jgi:glycosyltransferase involved in cell wall biosynthesis
LISIILLTFNSEKSIARTLDGLRHISDDIHAVDSFSTDGTLAILRSFGTNVVQRPFNNYADQRNWAIDHLPLKHEWQFHLDADEQVDPELLRALQLINFDAADGFMICRRIVFMGKLLRYSSIAKTWHYRLFRRGHGRCEDRLYDQHFVGVGRVGTLGGCLLDHQEDTLSEWTARHNRWSDLESREVGRSQREDTIQPALLGNPIQRKRAMKQAFYRMPPFARALVYFLLRYIVQGGFLDGTRGLIYHVLQGFWFRFLTDAKVYEASVRHMSEGER